MAEGESLGTVAAKQLTIQLTRLEHYTEHQGMLTGLLHFVWSPCIGLCTLGLLVQQSGRYRCHNTNLATESVCASTVGLLVQQSREYMCSNPHINVQTVFYSSMEGFGLDG